MPMPTKTSAMMTMITMVKAQAAMLVVMMLIVSLAPATVAACGLGYDPLANCTARTSPASGVAVTSGLSAANTSSGYYLT